MGEIVNYAGETAYERGSRIPELPEAPNEVQQKREFAFNGALILDTDALSIGLNNYADLQNLRYVNVGLEGVQGYTQINTTALSSEPNIRSGIQLLKRLGGTLQSHVLVQSYNAGLTTSSIYLNTTAIPSQGDFDATALWTDSSGSGLGRFALGPDGTVIYCNGVDTLIWGSAEHRVAGVVNYDDPDSTTFRHEITTRMNNNQQDSANIWTLVLDGTDIWLLVGSTRPLQGIKFYVLTANTAASTSTVEYWDGTAWQTVSGFSDGTASGGVTLAQTGTMSFDSTVSTAKTQIFDTRLLYYYRVRVGATGTPDSTIDLYQITVDAPIQPIIDLWDGTERNPLVFQIYIADDDKYYDYTLDVQEPSYTTAPIGANLTEKDNGGIAFEGDGDDKFFLGFEERMTGIRLRLANAGGVREAGTLQMEYWDGTDWVEVDNLVDGTIVSNITFRQSGLISWTAPDESLEFQQELFGVQGFFYRFTILNKAQDAEGTIIDTFSGIPAQRFNSGHPIYAYKFPLSYRGRVMLCGAVGLSQGNRIDYSAIGAPDVYNGEDASALGKSIYVGDQEDLTAGLELYNRYGDSLAIQAVLTKARQTWLLVGASPVDFQLFTVSETIGCPCPLTLDRADVTFSVDTQAVRNIAIWISYQGPMIFDGGILSPMRFQQRDGSVSSIDPYFDPNDSRYVTVSALENARGWFDPQYSEYNVLLPTGGSTTCNVWLVADMRRRKWFRKVPAAYPQAGFRVVDVDGGQYVYGGLDTGRLMRLENGNTWDGTDISHQVDLADMILSGSIWQETLLRYVRAALITETGTADSLTLSHAANGSGSFSAVATLALTSGGSDRYRRVTDAVNLNAWSHQFRMAVTTNDKARAPRLINWGFIYEVERENDFDSIDNTVGQGTTGP